MTGARRWRFFIAFAVVTLLIAGGLSYLASSSPDGLDSATLQGCQVVETADGEHLQGECIAQHADQHALAHSPLADYTLGGRDGTNGVAGIAGVALAGLLPAPLVIFCTFVGFVVAGWGGALAMTAGVFGDAPELSDGAVDPLSPEHVVNLVRFLASPSAEGVNGQLFIVYGPTVTLIAAPTAERQFSADGDAWDPSALSDELKNYFADRDPEKSFSASMGLGDRD